MAMWAARGYHVHRGLQRQQILCALGSIRTRTVAGEGGGHVIMASVSPSPWPRSMGVDGLNCRIILISAVHTHWCSFRSTTWLGTPECKLRNG
eukprot:6220-Pyramimonas_sp.AAC.1